MSGFGRRLARRLGLGGDDPAAVERLTARLDAADASGRAELARQDALIRQVAADLTERVAALERRVGALEARDR